MDIKRVEKYLQKEKLHLDKNNNKTFLHKKRKKKSNKKKSQLEKIIARKKAYMLFKITNHSTIYTRKNMI